MTASAAASSLTCLLPISVPLIASLPHTANRRRGLALLAVDEACARLSRRSGRLDFRLGSSRRSSLVLESVALAPNIHGCMVELTIADRRRDPCRR